LLVRNSDQRRGWLAEPPGQTGIGGSGLDAFLGGRWSSPRAVRRLPQAARDPTCRP
jgi:hypothetical protein